MCCRTLQLCCKNSRQVDSSAHSSVQAHSFAITLAPLATSSIQPHQPLKQSMTNTSSSIFFCKMCYFTPDFVKPISIHPHIRQVCFGRLSIVFSRHTSKYQILPGEKHIEMEHIWWELYILVLSHFATMLQELSTGR